MGDAESNHSATVTYSYIQGLDYYSNSVGNIGVTGINDDPYLDSYNRLSGNSPCIDTGDNTAVPAEILTDLDGTDRFVDIPNIPTSGGTNTVDMGASEFSDCDDNGTDDLTDLLVDDCNGNGIPDACDIEDETSSDDNNDGVPDECQPPAIISAVSLKTHSGQSYDFDYGISAGDVECRNGGISKIVLTYDIPILSEDGDALVWSDFDFGGPFGPVVENAVPSLDNKTVTLTISDANDNGLYLLSFVGENESGVQQEYDYCWTLLVGDANGDGTVNVTGDLLNYMREFDGLSAEDDGGAAARADLDLDNLIEYSGTQDDLNIVSDNDLNTATLCTE